MLIFTMMTLLNTVAIDAKPFHFNQLQDKQYMIVNDGVMGGRSDSELSVEADVALFTGLVSLENNGGFASVRMIWPFKFSAKQQPKMLELKVKGDGKAYQFRLRTDRGFDGAAYTYQFDTIANQEQTIYIPVDQFVPTFRGRTLKNMPELELKDVQQMGVLIADYQKGEFSIELISLSVK